MKYLLLLSSLMASCVTPDKWTPASHIDMTHACKNMCGKQGVSSYEPFSGTCECNKK